LNSINIMGRKRTRIPNKNTIKVFLDVKICPFMSRPTFINTDRHG
jgi:hypothetical protein